MKNSARDLLASYIDALYPIIYINHFDFKLIYLTRRKTAYVCWNDS